MLSLRNDEGMSVAIMTLLLALSTTASAVQFAGGTGDPNDPYQIATAEQLIAIGSDPNLLNGHFVLVSDIDLDPNLPGRRIFDQAVIAPDTDKTERGFQGGAFMGDFDGQGHTISHLVIDGADYLGLFGQLWSAGHIHDVIIHDAVVTGMGGDVGALIGYNAGRASKCGSTGTTYGAERVGGLVGGNQGYIVSCYSHGIVTGRSDVGGLVGCSYHKTVSACYSTAAVSGNSAVGGLAGLSSGTLQRCYSSGPVSGKYAVGGLVGSAITRDGFAPVWNCVYDVVTSEQPSDRRVMGLTTADMKDPVILSLNGWADDPNWVLDAGRDYPRLAWEGTSGQPIPKLDLGWLEGSGRADDPYLIQSADDLILLGKASVLWDSCFALDADIDLDPNLPGRRVFTQPLILDFDEAFDGNGHVIRNLTITGGMEVGLFGRLGWGANVRNLILDNVRIKGTENVGALAGFSRWAISSCGSTGTVTGRESVGGLIGLLRAGSISHCWSTAIVSGAGGVGGLVGGTDYYGGGKISACRTAGMVIGEGGVGGLIGSSVVPISECSSMSTVIGMTGVGGLAGSASSHVSNCYSAGTAAGSRSVGGLIGWSQANVLDCYSAAAVSSDIARSEGIGGLIGEGGGAAGSFWNIETSGQVSSRGGIGLTMPEMKDIRTYLDAGWSIRDAFTGGPDANWFMPEDGYPLLAWELDAEDLPAPPVLLGLPVDEALAQFQDAGVSTSVGYDYDEHVPASHVVHLQLKSVEGSQIAVELIVSLGPYDWAETPDGSGSIPISRVSQLLALASHPELWDRHFVLTTDLDLGTMVLNTALIAPDVNATEPNFQGPRFNGTFDGAGHSLINLTISSNGDYLGLFGALGPAARIHRLRVENVRIEGTIETEYAGPIAGTSQGVIENCHTSGSVKGGGHLGRFVGDETTAFPGSASTVWLDFLDLAYPLGPRR